MKTCFYFQLLFTFCFFGTFPVAAQLTVGNTTLQERTVATHLNVPWEILWGPDNFIWVTERYGRISRIDPATGQVIPLVTIPDVAMQNESGLLGMVLHPDFANQPYVYTAYTYLKGGTLTKKLVRYTYTGSILAAPLILLDDIPAAPNHNGCRLIILPDTTLLMTTGDADNAINAQNPNNLSGKTLRLNPDGTIPADNPVAGSYVYTLGHRNAQGLTRAANGLIYSSEHGPANDDELNLIMPGRNYGWPHVEGFCNLPAEQSFCAANNVAEPLVAWTPTLAVAGLAYYDHPAIPEWQHSILMVTLKSGRLVHLPLNPAGTAITGQTDYFAGNYGRLRAVCVSPDGSVYFSTSNKDGRANPAASDDRIIELTNLNYQPSGIAHQSTAAIQIFPNPVVNRLQLKIPQNLKVISIDVLDITGKQQAKGSAFVSEASLDLSLLPAGTYLVRLVYPEGTVIRKIIKTSQSAQN